MEDTNKVYRIRTKVGEDSPNVIHVPLNQTYDMFEILSLTIDQKNVYKTYESDYGVVVGRVIANGGVGVPNAKVSIFIEASSEDTLQERFLYNFSTPSDTDNKNIRYNLLPDDVDNVCHQDVGTFPNKRYVLDNQDIIETFDKYWKYTTVTNNSGDYMIFGVPTGSQTLHCDIDLSDCGILSQRPRDMIYKGYNADMFESPNKFNTSTNLDSLAQIVTQNKGIYVYPYWGDISNGDDSFAITRCDIEIEYKFEPTAVFMGCIITDKGNNSIGKNCTATKQSGKMADLIAGEGTIEMIRKTIDNKVEEFPIKGNRLIDGDGVWCYQIPMNLDIVKTDEFGNLVPTDDPNKGIATRARVRFRISLDENPNDATATKRAKYLVPNNPRMGEGEFDETLEADYAFGTETREESYCDLFWNKVYTVKNYIPKIQKNKKDGNRKHTGIKLINEYGDNNPMPYNAVSINLGFTYRIICTLTKVLIKLIEHINNTLTIIAATLCLNILLFSLPLKLIDEIEEALTIPLPGPLPDINLGAPLTVPLKAVFYPLELMMELATKLIPNCISLSSEFCNDGVNSVTYYPGCGYAFFGDLPLSSINILGQTLDCIWKSNNGTIGHGGTEQDHYQIQLKECEKEHKTEEECEEAFTTASNETAMLENCVENQLAQQNDTVSFNFYNDWINGALYAPLWYREIKKKRKYFFGLIKRRAKDDWCSADRSYPGMRIIKHCAIQRKTTNRIKNFDNEEVYFKYVDEARYCGSKCHKSVAEVQGLKGVILTRETILGQTVYYYKAVEYDEGLPNNFTYEDYNRGLKNNVSDKPGDIKLMFATDIVLLGSLNECDIHGVPQFFKTLESTTYNMPPDVLFTDYDYRINRVTGESEFVFEGVTTTSEMAGRDWGNPNEFNKYDGGLFYGIGCTDSGTKLDTRSCINLQRVCEYGVSLDVTKDVENLPVIKQDLDNISDEDINGGDDADERYSTKLITDGFISWDELYNLDERSMFATMNANKLKTKLNEKNGLREYDFRYLYPENFDGSLRETMKETTKEYDSRINYKNNWKLETGSKDYYLFRMGNRPYFYDMNNNAHQGYSFPRYENSFYFYFGLKSGKTAIDKFNTKYFSECFNPDSTVSQIGIKYKANSWCVTDKNDGYLALDFSNIEEPYTLVINGVSNRNYSITINDITDDKVIFISDENNIPFSLDKYKQLRGEEIGTNIYDYSSESQTVIEMLNNGSYEANVTDGSGNVTNFTFTINGKYLVYNINTQTFEESNNTLMEIFNNNLNAISTDIVDISTADATNVTRKIGGVIDIFDLFSDSERMDAYKIVIEPKSSLGNYTDFTFKYNNGKVSVYDNQWIIVKDFTNYPNNPYIGDGTYDLLYADKDHHYAVGVPKGCFEYTIIITQLCIIEGVETDSRNVVTKTVTVECPLPFKMYINDIDYDVIKNFDDNTGWKLTGTVNNPSANPVESNNTVSVSNPWFKIDNIYFNRFTYEITDENDPSNNEIVDYTDLITKFEIERNNPREFYEINDQTHVINENEYFDLDNEHRAEYKEIYRIYAVISDSEKYEVDEQTLLDEFKNNTGTIQDVPYNWVDDYVVEEYVDIDDFIKQVNSILLLRREIVLQMKDTFYLSCENGSKNINIKGRTDKLPCTQTIVYHPEKAVENEDYNVLDGDSLVPNNVDRIYDIKIPTITYKGSVYFGDGSSNDTPCLVSVENILKKPYSIAIMNNGGMTIPKDSNNQPFENEQQGNAKYIKWQTTDLNDLFSFPIIDKILSVDYIAWSTFIGIPYYKKLDNNGNFIVDDVSMNGLLSGIIFNGNITNNRFETQTLNDYTLKLSNNIADSTQTYVEKHVINGYNYDSIINDFLNLIKDSITLNVTRETIEKLNQILKIEIINPDNITPETLTYFKSVISNLTVNNNLITYDDGYVAISVSAYDILGHILAFNRYVVDASIVDNEMQYAFVLPTQSMFVLADRNNCGQSEIIDGMLKVELSDESVNDCKTGQKVVKVNTTNNDTYYSIFKVNEDGTNYPLNLADFNGVVYQIEESIDNVYSSTYPQNLFSFQTKTKHLRGENSLIDTRFTSEELVDSTNSVYETRNGYGTTGEFVQTNFAYPIFIVSETNNHVRSLSPVYDYSEVKGVIKYGKYNRKDFDSSQNTSISSSVNKLGAAISNKHYYLDNYSYELSCVCQVNSATIINIPQQTLLIPNQFIFTDIDDATYDSIPNIPTDSITITAIDYTGLKHICLIENNINETQWQTFIFNLNVPEGYSVGDDTCGLIVNNSYIDYIEYVYEDGETDIKIPDVYTSLLFNYHFAGWYEPDDPNKTIVIDEHNNPKSSFPSSVNDSKVYYAKWENNCQDGQSFTATFNYTFNGMYKAYMIPNVTCGGTVQQPTDRDDLSANDIWYIQGTTIVANFPYTVTNNITFVRHEEEPQPQNQYTVRWLDEIEEEPTDEYFDPIIENNTGTTTLVLRQYGIDTKAKLRLAANFDKTTSTSKIWAFSCAGSVYAEFVKNNTGGINVTGSNATDYSMIDDYGMLFKRTSGYGSWQGGTSTSASYSRSFDISPVKKDTIVRHVDIKGYADENNNILLRGDIVNKAIRVPSSGINSKIDTWQYPYTFDSMFYYTNPKMTYVTKTGSSELTATVANDNTLNVNGFTATLENVNDNALDYRFEYEIAKNTTGDYKYHMIVIDSNGLSLGTGNLYGTNATNANIVMLHFIQEYKVKNRIYYGYGFTTKTFDDNYNERSSNAYKYHSWFETCSSKILLEDTTTLTDNGTYVAYPNSSYFEYNFSVTNGTFETVSTNYIWGDEAYTIVTISSGNARFTKK